MNNVLSAMLTMYASSDSVPMSTRYRQHRDVYEVYDVNEV